ncbi:unnamed protein product [Leptidea sinapis]|uniref:Uncharacterized protein n=1 Tax=Leptidea sinapis TaxID=189913 RepID=A0A5E4Q731_9NEOP|nr:unnamed protein product [Leptidea sinapis]
MAFRACVRRAAAAPAPFYKAWVRPHYIEYCFYLWSAARIVWHSDIISTIWMCGGPSQCAFQGAFFHVLQSCGMSFLVRSRTFKASNAPVIPLVLQENVSGGDHLTPGDQFG